MERITNYDWEDFLEQLSEEEQQVCSVLRSSILETLPHCKEKIAYQVPFYKARTNVCYLWPSSILWGKKKTYEGVRLGFVHGHLLYDDINYLTADARKYVRCRDFLTTADIDPELLQAYLYDALRVDEARYQEKKHNNSPKNRTYNAHKSPLLLEYLAPLLCLLDSSNCGHASSKSL